MKDHWTAAEYREYLRTQREPVERKAASQTSCRSARPPTQEEIERRYAEAEKRGEVYALMFDPSAAKPLETARVERLKYTEFDPAPPKRIKYGNRRTEVNGLKFDSKHEADIYQELMARKEAGELRCVWRQVGFDLPGGIRYFADFVTVAKDYTIRVLDAKSEATKKNRVYINKKKQVKALWDIDIEEV